MQNAQLHISEDGILTIGGIDLKQAIGESKTEKTYTIACSDSRFENFTVGENAYYIAFRVGMYKEAPKVKQQASFAKAVSLPWGSKPGKADLSAATARQDSNGIAPGKSGSVKIVNHKS